MEQGFEQVIEMQRALGEAGGVAWVDLHGTKVVDGVSYEVKISLTNRDITATNALDGLIDAIKHAEDVYKMRPYIMKTGRVSDPFPVGLPDPFPVSIPPAPAGIPVGKPEPVYEDLVTGGIFNITKMIVTVSRSGKTQVDYYEAGKKYKSISKVGEPEQIASAMSAVGAWTPNHFAPGAMYEGLNFKIKWQNSDKKTDDGKYFFKDILGFLA
jgi:hypothetical protein